MRQTIIENPIINSPFEEPRRHFKIDGEGITNEIVEGRRKSIYFTPVPRTRGRSRQLGLWNEERIEENKFINQVRERVSLWRKGGYRDVTRTTRQLLEYWNRPDRERRLFFCQREAAETAIYITEVAKKYGDAWIEDHLRKANAEANPGLPRIAFKMATGSGKTTVMSMLIGWHVLNKKANPQDARFTDAFLIVTPGITIRDRLRVLLPSDPDAYYRRMDIVPPDMLELVGESKIVIANFHAFQLREKVAAARTTKKILAKGGQSPFVESPEEMVRRVCRELGNKKNIIVINDEAHHCYRRKVDAEEEKLKGDERKEAQQREEEARVWVSGIEAMERKLGVKAVYDLSATPFFLRGSGYREGTLFPWVVSDFSLIDAIESGIVKVPRLPVDDNAKAGEMPMYRLLWDHIKDKGLPKKGRKTQKLDDEPILPKVLEGALHSLYNHYEIYFLRWHDAVSSRANDQTPPVFIVVCNNTNVSKLIYNYIGGWDKTLPDGSVRAVPGKLPHFSNVENGVWRSRPYTILVDSTQLESGEAMSKEFKEIASREIEEFKQDYRRRFPGRDTDKLTDEDLLREVMNTVGKPGKLGEQIRCVVSVSMLTEGWDANTVTHILGVRAFGTQLLCEQVVGRGLRRMSYATQPHTVEVNGQKVEIEAFPVEYAEVYGVPFAFIPAASPMADPKPGPIPTRVRALDERLHAEITFPRLKGYRYDLPATELSAKFSEESRFVISTRQIPTETENAPIIGEKTIHTLDDLKQRRMQEVAFELSKLVLEVYFRDESGHWPPQHFPRILQITREWLSQCVRCKDDTFPQLLLLKQNAHDAAARIYRSIAHADAGQKILKPILYPYDPVGSTRYVDFDTTRPVYETDPRRSHVTHVVADTESWEQKMAQALESMTEVVAYVKNQNLGFTIPYAIEGEERWYHPDFIVKVDDGASDPLNLILEVTGAKGPDKAAKVHTARALWVPAVNNHGGFGRWDFHEVRDPWDVKEDLRSCIKEASGERAVVRIT